MKRILQTVLLLLVVAGVAVGIYQKTSRENPITANEPEPSIAENAASAVTVTYFTTDTRCATCKKIESLTIAALEEQFAEELDSGVVVFETHNIDQPANKHFIKQYQLSFKTVVISTPQKADLQNQPNWKRMDKVWDLHPTPDAFKAYIGNGVREAIQPNV